MNIRIGKRLLILQPPKLPKIIFAKIPQYAVYGLTNRTEDGYYLPFLDYDNVEDTIVKQDIIAVQKRFNIGSCIVRLSNSKTKYRKSNGAFIGSFHVIFFDKVNYKTMRDIIDFSRCDDNYKKASFQQRVKVLRLSNKGKKIKPYFHNIWIKKGKYKQSKAHAEFFQKIDNKPIIKYLRSLDNSEGVELINYLTA